MGILESFFTRGPAKTASAGAGAKVFGGAMGTAGLLALLERQPDMLRQGWVMLRNGMRLKRVTDDLDEAGERQRQVPDHVRPSPIPPMEWRR